ncbi:MAG TPA: fibrinogen-binding protein, partial [Candidatus Binatia bacterium]
TRIGVFRPATRDWILDFDGHGDGKNCGDACVSFGSADDLPVVGDWDGNGADKIGVYRPSTGEWFLDLNGNRTWDGCAVDLCLGPFGEPGDLPVVGKWM